jgi:hypothetical protein
VLFIESPESVDGTSANKVQDMIAFEAFNRLIGLPEYNRLEERYAVA